MKTNITEALKLMCDMSNPQDRKILLLAELFERKCNSLADNQKGLQDSLNVTNEKIDKLLVSLNQMENNIYRCPVYKNKDNYEKISFYVKNPKLTVLIIIGLLALLCGFFSTTINSILAEYIGI